MTFTINQVFNQRGERIKVTSTVVAVFKSQVQFLEWHLRGTCETLTARQAREEFGIQRLPARMSELRQLGLRVRTTASDDGTVYSISRRDMNGSARGVFA
jgi:hypothetical protein